MKAVRIRHGCAEGITVGLATQFLQQRKNCQNIRLAGTLLPPDCAFGQGIGILAAEPETCRQHGADRLVKSAEIPLPHEGGQLQHHTGNHRFLIQRPVHCLEGGIIPLLNRQYDTLGTAVAPAKGDHDPLAAAKRHILSHTVGIGLVDGISRGRNCDFCDHKPFLLL